MLNAREKGKQLQRKTMRSLLNEPLSGLTSLLTIESGGVYVKSVKAKC